MAQSLIALRGWLFFNGKQATSYVALSLVTAIRVVRIRPEMVSGIVKPLHYIQNYISKDNPERMFSPYFPSANSFSLLKPNTFLILGLRGKSQRNFVEIS